MHCTCDDIGVVEHGINQMIADEYIDPIKNVSVDDCRAATLKAYSVTQGITVDIDGGLLFASLTEWKPFSSHIDERYAFVEKYVMTFMHNYDNLQFGTHLDINMNSVAAQLARAQAETMWDMGMRPQT